MKRVLQAAVAIVATLAVLGGIGWASRAPYDAPGADAATLRLSWRMPGASAQVCRDRTQAELDALPAHMRTPQICETRLVMYRLETRVDDAQPRSQRLRPSGARGDRPLAVWLEVPLALGPHRIAIRLRRETPDDDERPDAEHDENDDAGPAGHEDDDEPDDDDDDEGDHEDDDDDDDDTLLELDTTVVAVPGGIVLVTLDDAGRLVVR